MRVLVTGGCGFLGGAFAVLARQAGHSVVSLDRAPEADLICDIGDPGAIAAAVLAVVPDAVVHLAAALTDAAAADAVAATRINALGTAALFAASRAQGVARVVYASSVAAVGPCAEGSGDDVALAPGSIYGATKAFGEHLARAMAEAGPTSFLALRFGWVYGPGRVRGWRVAQDVIERFMRGERRVPYPDIAEPIDWTWVDDAAGVLLRSLSCPVDKFAACNVCGDRRPIGAAVAHLLHRFPDAVAVPEAVAMPPAGWGMVNDRLQAVLGYVPQTRLEEGIDRILSRSSAPASYAGNPAF